MGLYKLVRSKGYKNFMAKLYGWGASIVILGALFKILHIRGADAMLMLGMSTEALIFFFSAFEPLHKEYDWSIVYPELGHSTGLGGKPKTSVCQKLDKMLEEAKIGPELIESLSSGMRNLSENAKRLSYTTDAALVTDGYVANLSKAKDAVQNLASVYEKSANAIYSTSDLHVKNMQDLIDSQKRHAQEMQTSLASTAAAQTKSVQEMIDVQKQHAQKLQDSFSTTSDMQIKSVQELLEIQKQHAQKLQEAQILNIQKVGQLHEQGNQSILENYKKIQENTSMMANSLNDTAQETQKYKQEVDKMSKNVAQINSIYANMLAAMTNK